MNTLISGTRSEADVGLPINIQGGGGMESKLLSALARRCVPDDGRLVDTSGQNVIALFVPFQGKNRALVLSQSAS